MDMQSNIGELEHELKAVYNTSQAHLIDIVSFKNKLVYLFYSFVQNKIVKVETKVLDSNLSLFGQWDNAAFIESCLQKDKSIRFEKNYGPHYEKLFIEDRLLEVENEALDIDLWVSQHKNNYQYLNEVYYQLERANKIEISEKDKVIRMIVLEVSNAASLLNNLKNYFLLLKDEKSLACIEKTEKDLVFILSQLEDEKEIFTWGGVDNSIDIKVIAPLAFMYQKSLVDLEKKLKRIVSNNLMNEVFSMPFLDKESIIKHGLTGLYAQAGGLNLNWRKHNGGIYFYNDLKVPVNIASQSSFASIFNIIIRELELSSEIIDKLISNFPISKNIHVKKYDSSLINFDNFIVVPNNWGFSGHYLNVVNGEIKEQVLIGSTKYKKRLINTFCKKNKLFLKELLDS